MNDACNHATGVDMGLSNHDGRRLAALFCKALNPNEYIYAAHFLSLFSIAGTL